ncbi:hypothetical protein [Streptomyces sp. WMMC1477]|uniref:hypothetical protein n=1 Tax=Streptomyces sp. WMMC1477 TaxID=3015155 RepID=UPI0022B64146|nr:hypothetical protein [Streptomyces sp. WMMC1477]MCZ7430112.1 hypothetical protein [Streptomyces sp. WMMC1477]
MGVKYVIAEPEPPTWWQQHRTKFIATATLLLGYWLGSTVAPPADGAVPEPTPTPSASTSAD